jgi:ribonuclease BN (tRNA processing enzyme)
VELTVLGAHDLESKTTRATCLLVDDHLAIDAGGLTSALTLEQQSKISTVLLTHHHFDHTRDLVTLGFNNILWQGQIKVYGLPQTFEVVVPCLLDGKIYVNLLEHASLALKGSMLPNPARAEDELSPIKLCTITPYQEEIILGYNVLPVPVPHSVPTVGYLVRSESGQSLFYTGDTGPGLSDCWHYIKPDLLVIETTGPNKLTDKLSKKGHLSPQSLKRELLQFKSINGYLPEIMVVHRAPPFEELIKEEIKQVSEDLQVDIMIGYEGMEVIVQGKR